MRTMVLAAFVTAWTLGMPIFAQRPTGPLAFEVATVKPVNADAMSSTDVMVYPGGRVAIHGMTLKELIMIAFDVSGWQIEGGSSAEKFRFDIEAKPPGPAADNAYDERHGFYRLGDLRLQQMMQTLLIERFGIKFHSSSKEADMYVLERSGKPLKLAPSRFQVDRGMSPMGVVEGTGVQINNMSMLELAKFLSGFVLHREVVDETGLKGFYDFKSLSVVTSTEMAADSNGIALSAVKEMGLRLRASKGPVTTFVIDHIEPPSPN